MRNLSRATVSTGFGAIVLGILVGCGGGGEPGEPADLVDTTAVTADTAAPEAPPETPPRGSANGPSGQAVFTANCATCHGAGGEGDGPAAVGLEPPPADLSDGTWVTGDGSIEAIVNTIENGSPGTAMIGWQGTLTEAQIDAVARYVKSLGGN